MVQRHCPSKRKPRRARRRQTSWRTGGWLLEERCLLAAPSNVMLALTASTISENSATSLSGSFSDADANDDHLLVISWGDGTANETIGPLGIGVSTFGPISHIYRDDSPTGTASDSASVGVTVIDGDLASASGTATITVNNVAPGLGNVAVGSPIDENGVATLSGNIVDPGTRDTFTLVVTWGDGSAAQTYNYPAGTTSFSETHRYVDDDPTGTSSDRYIINLTLTDDDTGSATATANATVNNVAPTLIGVTASSPIDEGAVTTLSGMIADPGSLDRFTLQVNWGDGSALQTFAYAQGTSAFSETHRYKNDGSFSIDLALADDDSGTTTASTGVAVNNVRPSLSAVTLPAAVEGRLATLSGMITDPGVLDTFTLVVNWGDGSAAETFTYTAGTTRFTERHRYQDEGSYPVGLSLKDDAVGSTPVTANTTAVITNGDVIVVGKDSGGAPEVRVFDSNTGQQKLQFLAYPANFHGGVHVATGDVNGDGVYDIVTGPGRGSPLEVRVFDGIDGSQLSGPIGSFLAYNRRFRGGVFVAAGDINRDGFDDVITAPGPGVAPLVQVFSGADGSLMESFLAFDSKFRQGVTVAAGDVNGDGKADIIAGAGPGGIPQVRVFDGPTGKPFSGAIGSFLAYDATFRGGVFVAAGDVNGDGMADILTAPGRGMAPLVRAFDALTSAELRSLLAYPTSFQDGVRVAAGDVNGNGRADIISAPGPGREPQVRAFDALTSSELESFLAFEASSHRGVFVSASR